jgi:cytochrome d ubiquinol oxidase subunit I
MRKLIVLVLVLAAFLAILTFYIVPQQGGLISSTELQADALQQADPQYEETLPIQEVSLGRSGRSIVIALVMLSHVLYANLHLGGSWVAAITESLFLKNGKERYRRLARSVTLFNVMLFSAGATFAVAGVLFFIALYPVFAQELFHIYWWPFLLEAITFALEIFFLYTYWFTWDKVRPGWHQFLGYGYAVDVFLQTLLINMVAGGMLTPGGDSIAWGQTGLMPMAWSDAIAWWLNGTVFRLQFHRLAAAVSYFGFLLAMLAMFHYLDQKDQTVKRYWDWVGSYGVAWGLLGLVFQPVLGLIYMLAIRDNQQDAFEMIMHGSRAWEMLLMVSLFSSLFLTVITYFIDRRERILTESENRTLHTLFKVFLVVAAVCALVLVQPAWLQANSINDPTAWTNPLGSMDYKYVALFALVVIGALILMLDAIMLGDVREAEWGNLSGTSRTAAIMAGVLGMWIVVVMGYVRESARSPWTVFKVIPVPGGQAYPTPIPISRIFIVWIVVMAATLLVFWFTSKVTAHHPEKAEEV